jgi:hypothetical protein
MADFLVATIESQLPFFTDQILKASEYLTRLKDAGQVKMGQGGDGFKFRARKSKSALVRAIGDNSTVQAASTDNWQTIEGDYRAYAGALKISRLQRKRNEGAGAAKIIDLAVEQVNEVYQAFEEYLTDDLMGDGTAGTGDDSTPFDGLTNINDTDNTYLGIDRSVTAGAWWRSHTRAVTGSFADDTDADGVCNGVAGMRLAFLDACGGAPQDKGIARALTQRRNKPDLIMGPMASFVMYCNALAPQQQYVGNSKQDPGQEVAFFNVPFVWDTFCTADVIRFLTLKYLHLYIVGSGMIYLDNELKMGGEGESLSDAYVLVSQGQHFCNLPTALSELTNTDD